MDDSRECDLERERDREKEILSTLSVNCIIRQACRVHVRVGLIIGQGHGAKSSMAPGRAAADTIMERGRVWADDAI